MDRDPSIIVRHDLRPGDMGSIIHLHGKLYGEEHGFDHTFEIHVAEPLVEFVRNYSQGRGKKIWIVEKEGRVMGSLAIVRCSDEEAQLRWFLVHPELRGKGIGRRLVEEALSFCRESGFSSVFLWTVNTLKPAASLYRSVGFKKTAESTARMWGKVITEERYDLVLK
ncbi:MAG: GNAT family N-acetyltransferase [Deltaproteobacteria bacterium]|nr:GNAT family N-acetyltransferase [Deltaproteobacteria bacterium]MBW2016000.1 GNAT family N-acetyltransferase [Deltaproteobacteria bacterium]MBW2128934.1 GNAT family N-acetyltransferase [Deltaproteobacteria bacterium]MBW2303436.1 GNAT family N-acetyltransferase [Deltaproteobacteria bacterium]